MRLRHTLVPISRVYPSNAKRRVTPCKSSFRDLRKCRYIAREGVLKALFASPTYFGTHFKSLPFKSESSENRELVGERAACGRRGQRGHPFETPPLSEEESRGKPLNNPRTYATLRVATLPCFTRSAPLSLHSFAEASLKTTALRAEPLAEEARMTPCGRLKGCKKKKRCALSD